MNDLDNESVASGNGGRSFASHIGRAAASIDCAAIFDAADKVASELLSRPEFAGRDRYIMAGSGDSLFAARSTVPAIKRWSGMDFEVLTSIEFSRYELDFAPDRTVLIAVSNSGSSTRTRESVHLAKACGIPALGIVGSLNGPLAEMADLILHRPVALGEDKPEWAPRLYLNMIEYVGALIAMYGLGLALGERNGRLSAEDAATKREAITRAVEAIGHGGEIAEPLCDRLLDEAGDLDTIWIIGAGPNAGTAEYSAAKFHEQVPINGIPQDLEEWAHLQYFLTLELDKPATVLVLGPQGRSFDRAAEMLTGIRNAGGRGILVTNSGDEEAAPDAALRITMPLVEDEYLTPITFHLPAQIIAMHLAHRRGVAQTPRTRRDDYWLIRKGDMITDPAKLR
ncbi:SIS domain-containing protein [Jiella marina]|uniref:SIS domain-containing protein n=1 Tax=Jiella sp. LLJ827 TaxID=2917712 RepID=UPI0021015674|nr:SIS domain-containing protein [Jiella sp. LLJ827]MCQ0986308.1 SIS domain-containing protein [Jiella sp. LLJ827]